MKKVVLLFMLVFAINSAFAQDADTITKITTTLPLILLGVGVLFFIGLYLKDNFDKIVKLFSIKRHKTTGFQREAAKIDFGKELDKIKKDIATNGVAHSLRDLSALANKFFSEQLHLNYNFTSQELTNELQGKKPAWVAFSKEISYLKYTGRRLNNPDIERLIEKLE